MANKWCLLLVGLLAAMAQAAPLLLQGKIGEAAVVMELDIDDAGQVMGRYFYRKYHRDIALDGSTQEDGSLVLGENLRSDERRSDLILHPQGQGWQGQWQGPKAAQPLPVVLKPLLPAQLTPSSDPALQPFRQSSPYDYERMAALKLVAGKIQRFQGYTLQWWREPVSSIASFRLQDGFDAATRQRLNQRLAQRQWQGVTDYFDCLLGGSRAAGGDFEQTVTPRLVNRQLLSVSEFTSYYCGGAHPDFGDDPLNLDVTTGRELQLEDLLWLGKGKPPLVRQDNQDRVDIQYKYTVLAPWLQRQFARLHPAVFKAGGQDDCDYNIPEVWQFVSWYATPKGLYLGPSFGRAVRACEYPDWSVLPWSLVMKHPGAAGYRLP
ncbi:hypothetical protein ACFOKJ_06810 [Vogesella amnigena]|uniref:DUF3298 domain-containing protein n=1 Tax=Vogesella amnigena TaxID=1507449 RepID=A0ABV7TSX1_9NEIS